MSDLSGDTWYVRSRGKTLGPFPFQQLAILRDQRRLAKFDEISSDRRTWVHASTMPDLFPPTSLPPQSAPDPRGTADAVYSVEADVPAGGEQPGWFFMSEKGQSDPVTATALIQLARSGVVAPETLVWTADLNDWVPARTVALLGFPQPKEAPKSNAVAAPTGSLLGEITFSVTGFVLGLLGLFGGALTLLTAAIMPAVSRNREVVGIVFLGLIVAWAVASLLSMTFGTVGTVKAMRSASRRGFGLGLTGLILGAVGVAGLIVLVFIAALGIIGSTPQAGT